MNSLSTRPLKSFNWQAIVLVSLGFWVSASLLIDLIVLPSLYGTGMMAQSGFASAGYILFGLFNHLELICGALVITGCLVLHQNHYFTDLKDRWSLLIGGVLLSIALIYTYFLTPHMSGLGMNLNWLEGNEFVISPTMMGLQMSYWGLELVKLFGGVTLIRWFYRHIMESSQ